MDTRSSEYFSPSSAKRKVTVHSFFIISFDEPYFLVCVSRINLRDEVENESSLSLLRFCRIRILYYINRFFFIENSSRSRDIFLASYIYIYIQNPTTPCPISGTTSHHLEPTIPLNRFFLAKKHNVRSRVSLFPEKTPSQYRLNLGTRWFDRRRSTVHAGQRTCQRKKLQEQETEVSTKEKILGSLDPPYVFSRSAEWTNKERRGARE